MKKRIISIVLILAIMVSSVNITAKKADAAWFIPFIPAISEALVSLAEILLLTTATVATGYAVSESFDMSDVDYVAGKLDNATDAAGDWWRDIKSHSYRIDNPSVSLEDDIAAGKIISWADYYESEFNVGGGPTPDPEEPRKSKKVDVTGVVAQQLADILAQMKGRTKINEARDIDSIIKSFLNNSGLPTAYTSQYDSSLIKYSYVTLLNCPWYGSGSLLILCSESKLNINVYRFGSKTSFYYGTGNNQDTYMNLNGKITEQLFVSSNYKKAELNGYSWAPYSPYVGVLYSNNGNSSNTYNYMNDSPDSATIASEINQNVKFSNYDIKVNGIGLTWPDDMYIASMSDNIPVSVYPSANTKNGFTITPTKELRDTISKAQPAKTTDDITKLVSDADKAARANGKQVINVDIDGNTSVQPDYSNDTKGIISTLKEFIGNPLQGLIDFLKDILNKILNAIKSIPDMLSDFIGWFKNAWGDINDLPGKIGVSIKNVVIELFVPEAFTLTLFKLQVEQIIETKTGILSYPFVLLIKLSDFVLNMDTKDCILIMPKIEFKGYVLCEEQRFNFTQFVHQEQYVNAYNTYLVITDFFLIVCVLVYAGRRIDGIMKAR